MGTGSFSVRETVRFAHVDAAGIVFYPRYFEMLNAAVEDWFALRLGADFASLHIDRRIGVPTVRLETEFFAASRLGDVLDIFVTPVHLGRSSCAIEVRFLCGDEQRLTARLTMVAIDLGFGKSLPWPADVRAAIARELGG